MDLRYFVPRGDRTRMLQVTLQHNFEKAPVVDDVMDEGPLPDYESPPVIETVLGVQFERLPGFRNGHLGAFWKSLPPRASGQWCPMPRRWRRSSSGLNHPQSGARGLHIQLTQVPTSRLQIRTRAGNRMIQIRNGRLHFNWLGTEGKAYPRYENVREGFVTALRAFLEFLGQKKRR